MFEMANITDVPPMYLLQKGNFATLTYFLKKGQQIKVFSQIAKDAMKKGFIIPQRDFKDSNSFTGAIVIHKFKNLFFLRY